jgi:branched-chain amino acid transport system substrate-binding protein
MAFSGQPAFAAEPYNINVVLPLTGPVSFLGKSEQIALQQAEKALAESGGIGGRPVKFIFHDDQSSPQTAVQLATDIVAEKPAVVLGSAVVALCNAMAPLMKNGPVLYCFSPSMYPPAGSFAFSSSVATRDLMAAQLRYFRAKGWNRIAIITSTDASGQDAAKRIKEVLADPENKDVEVVSEQNFNPADVSASAQISRIKAAQPQALVAWSTGAAIGTVFKAIVESGLNVPVATTDGNMTYAQMTQYASFLPKELYIPSPQWLPGFPKNSTETVVEAKRLFHRAFEQSEVKPDAPSSFAWDPVMLVVSALKKLGPNATADQVREYLANLQGFAGVNGIYDFKKTPQRGLDDSNVNVTRWNPAEQRWDVVSEPRGTPLTQ